MIERFSSIYNFKYFDSNDVCDENFCVVFGIPFAYQAIVSLLCLRWVIIGELILNCF